MSMHEGFTPQHDLALSINDVMAGFDNNYAWRKDELAVAFSVGQLRVQIGSNPNAMYVDLMGIGIDRFFGQLSKAVEWETEEDSGPIQSIGVLQMRKGRKKVAQINMWMKTPCVYSHAQIELSLPAARSLLEWLAPKVGWDLYEEAV